MGVDLMVQVPYLFPIFISKFSLRRIGTCCYVSLGNKEVYDEKNWETEISEQRWRLVKGR